VDSGPSPTQSGDNTPAALLDKSRGPGCIG